jgi:hypothetical protein
MKRTTNWTIATGLVMALSSAAMAEDAKPAQPAPSAPTEAKPAPAAGEVSAEVKAGTGVEKRAIVGESTTFPAGTTVWVWSLVSGAEGSIKHVWKRDGQVAWTATLNVGSKKWSTQSRRTIPKAGAWEVDVQTADGTSIGTVAFTVQ